MNSLPRARGAGQSLRTPVCTQRPSNAPTRVAAILYQDAQMGRVAVSIRSEKGLMDASGSINWDCGVITRLIENGCTWLECHIKDTNTTYRANMSTMLQHGQIQSRKGSQWVLHLRYWSVDGQPAAFEHQIQHQAQSTVSFEQPSLFDMNDKMAVYR